MQYANGLFFAPAYSRMYSARMTIGDRLDKAMKDAKIESQSALARVSRVPQATISRILKGGGKKGPETETIKKLAAACNVSFEWLNEGGEHSRRKAGELQEVRPVEPERPGGATADELIELLTGYNLGSVKERASMMALAKTAIKRAGIKKSSNN